MITARLPQTLPGWVTLHDDRHYFARLWAEHIHVDIADGLTQFLVTAGRNDYTDALVWVDAIQQPD